MSTAAGTILTGKRRWFALIPVALGVAMIILDATVVNVVLPTLIKEVGLTTTDAEWVTAAYSLTFASLLIVAGRLADRFGRRLIFVIGLVVFVVSSVLVAMSDSPVSIIGARALQGVGAAMILPSSLSILNSVFVGKSRAAAFAVWGATIGGMAAMGPLVGGWLTTDFSWHWAFLINVPIGVVVLIGALVFVPETKDKASANGADVLGILFSTLGLLGVVFALIEGQRYGWVIATQEFTAGPITWSAGAISIVFVSLIVGVASLVALLFVERSRVASGKAVIFDLRLFKIRSFAAGNVVALVVSLGEFGLLFTLPLFLQSVRAYTALETGVILLALAVGSFVASGAGAAMAQRIGPVRVLQIGMALEALGIIGLGFAISTTVGGWGLVPWLFLYGLGVGFATAQLTGVILSETPVAQSGQASAMQSTSRQVGAAIGTAILGTTLLLGLGHFVNKDLQEAGVPSAQAEQITQVVASSAGQAIPGLGDPVIVEAASQGFSSATKTVSLVAAIFVTLGLLASFLLPRNAARIRAEGYEPPKG
jgi:EmrB/QacA subfamily drug resistance transporter